MAKVKIGLSGLNGPAQTERSRHIHTEMDGNANFTTPNPTLVQVKAAIDAFELAYNQSRNRDTVKMEIMRLRRAEMLFIMNQLGAYVQEASGGDAEIILSSGYSIRGANIPHPVVAGEVHDVRAFGGSSEGKELFKWEKADDAVIYIIEVAPNNPGSDFELKGFTTKTQKEIEGFTTGNSYLVRITALGREEAGPHSDPVLFISR